jgi:Sulfotransferase domain
MQSETQEKIFGIGLSKTGTTSLYAALHDLGYRSATFRHMRSLGLEEWRRGNFSKDYLKDYDAVTNLAISG